MLSRVWALRGAPWIAVALALVGVVVVGLFVDVSPRVEGDFFFAEDDPQMQASREVAERFPGSPQVILRTEDLGGDSAPAPAPVAEPQQSEEPAKAEPNLVGYGAAPRGSARPQRRSRAVACNGFNPSFA